ncbi:MAG: hypothetical protein KC684_05500 [Candidatus Omnitrophica bacterium]|nr:hypothetical protein [Candidatus Omnitrophota bacterium]
MNEDSRMYEMTTRDYIKILFRHKLVIFLTMTTVMVAAIFGVLLRTPQYESQVKMLISGQKQAQAEYYTDIGLGGLRSIQMTLTQSEIVQSDPVIGRAVSVLKLDQLPLDYEIQFASFIKKPIVKFWAKDMEKKMKEYPLEQQRAFRIRLAMEDLLDRIEVEPIRDTELFLIKVKDYNGVNAMITANVVSRSYVIFDLEQQLAEVQLKYGEKNLSVVQLQEMINKMKQGLNGLPVPAIDAIGPASVKIIEQAKVPLKPAGISRVLLVILAFIVSIILSIMLAFGFEYMDPTFKAPSEAEGALGINCLGSLPKNPSSSHYHDLSEQLYFIARDRGVKSILFTSSMTKEGTAAIIANLGLYIAEHLNKKVLLIDANLRNPNLHKIFRMPEVRNFSNIVEGKATVEEGVKRINQNLHVLTSGSFGGYTLSGWKKLWAMLTRQPITSTVSFNPLRILESDGMRRLIEEVSQTYDFILVDSPSYGGVKDATIISSIMDGTVLVVNERKTRRQVVKNILDPLKMRKANLLGFVLNNRTYVIPRMIYDRV